MDTVATSEPAFKNADVSGLKIISKGGHEVQASEPAPIETPPAEQANTEPAEPVAQATPEPQETTETPEPAEQPQAAAEEVDFFEYLGEQTQGAISAPEHVFAVIEENQQLKAQLAERPQIEFPTEQAKLLYEYCSKFSGQELSVAQSTLNVLRLDLTKLPEKEKQFEAFALENNDLTRDEARQYFDAIYEKKYGNGALEDDAALKFEHQRETRKAEQTIQKLKEDFAKAPSQPAGKQTSDPSEQELAEIKQNVDRVLEEFGGVRYQYFDDPNSAVTIPIEDADVQRFNTFLSDPKAFFEDLTKQCRDAKGNFSYDKYVHKMFEFANLDKIREQSFKSGVTYGELKKIKEIKNTAVPKTQDTPPPPSNAPKSLAEAMLHAGIGKGKKAA